MKRSILAPALLAAAALTLAACGSDTTAVGAGPQTRPTGPDEVVVQVLIDGGFVPVEFALSTVPALTVLGDGTVVTGAAVLAIYPGPAIPPLQSVKIDAAQVDALVDKARELGLLAEPLDFGQPPVADAPNTTVTIVVGGTTYRHSANALGLDELPGDLGGVSASQSRNRRALQSFVSATENLPSGEAEWVPEEIAVFDIGAFRASPELPQKPVVWPLAQAPATGSDSGGGFPCTLVAGDDAVVLRAALAQANSLTPWVVDGQQRSMAFRPVVPGHPACPA